MLGAHLAHISTGNGGKAGVGAGIQKGLFCRCFLPFHALRYPLIPTLNRLDKAGLVMSSRPELCGEPVVEHGARKADVSPHPMAWQATGSHGLLDPAGLDVEIPGGLLGA
jgi:hypothetical protein